ncbi:hypothetical protein, partial [Pseudomonas oryzihabitans]|uniref:hypothetical protein n=1 Tax=Pseudomonas oryzihabitans TaxID=47885 RepID=UPI001D41931B
LQIESAVGATVFIAAIFESLVMRRILRKIAVGEYDALGDISTLADPGVVQHLVGTHQQMSQAVA